MNKIDYNVNSNVPGRSAGSASRPASGTVDYWRRPSSSSMGREGGLRRPSTTNTFTYEGVERGLHSLSEERFRRRRLEREEEGDEDDGRLMTPLSAAPINRLHTARALMQVRLVNSRQIISCYFVACYLVLTGRRLGISFAIYHNLSQINLCTYNELLVVIPLISILFDVWR